VPGDLRPLAVLVVGVSALVDLDEGERAFFDMLGRAISGTVARARFPAHLASEPARLHPRRRQTDDAGALDERRRLLADASDALVRTLDVEATLRVIVELVVPGLADLCIIDLVTTQGSLERVAVHREPARQREADGIWRFSPRREHAEHPTIRAIETGEAQLIPFLDDEKIERVSVNDEHADYIRKLGTRSMMIVPLAARGRTLGAITFASMERARTYNEGDLELAVALAERAAFAVDNARLFADAQRAIRTREDLLAVVSHDLRNPLSSILTSAALIARRAPTGEAGARTRKHTEIIQRSVERMDRLIGDLLDLASIEAGALSIDRRVHEAAPLLREALEAQGPIARERSIELLLDPVDPHLLVNCDRDRVLQVLTNLIGNAIKFTKPAGSIVLGVDLARGNVCFFVRDTGPGIAAEELPHIFDRFWQARRRARSGVGLGLSIAKGIVDAHGGRIWVESTVDVGSVFYFTLPSAG